MAASIVLESDQTIFLPGDEVKGRIRYQCPKSRKIDGVEVRFFGRLKTTIIERNAVSKMYNEYRDRVILFKDRLISGGKTTLEPGIHNWPFSFKFPATAAPRQVESWDSKYTEKQFPETVLPPSYHLDARGLILGYSSFVAYFLVAYIDFSDGKDSPATTELLLNYIPATDEPNKGAGDDAQNDKTCNIRGFELLRENERPQVKRWGFNNPTKPNLRFRMTLSTPKSLTPTEPWRVLVNLDVLPPGPKDVPITNPPQFLLKSITIKMNSKIELRIVRSSEHTRTIRNDDKTGTTFQDLGALTPGESKEIVMGKMKYVPATTNLSSLSRRYKLLVELVVETADHAHSFSLKCKEPVTVRPLPLLAREEGEAQEMMRADVTKSVAADLSTALGLGKAILEMIGE